MAKLSYEPNRVVGGAFALVGAVSALAIYYQVLTPEAAALWSALAMIVIPPIQGEIARRFTWPVAKIEDAAHVDESFEPATINQKARQGRRRKEAAKEGPSV